jgi:V/A-type H+/Na+-transporting ATPase subunit E
MANLAALLEKEAGAEIEAMLSEARLRASEIVATAKSEAESIVAQRDRGAVTQHEATLVRAKSAAQLEASSLKLNAQHAAVEGVIAAARSQIDALTKDEKQYEGVLGNLLKEAYASLGNQPSSVASITVNTRDKTLAEKLAAGLGLTGKVKADDSIQGGVRLISGNNIIENTLQGRLRALRDELASEISKILFNKG